MDNKIQESLKELAKELNKVPSVSEVNDCKYLPSYNTILRNGVSLSGEWLYRYVYDLSFNKCLNCNEDIPFSKRYNKFCNKSCSSIYNNKLRVGKINTNGNNNKIISIKSIFECRYCGIEFSRYKKNSKYCSISCQHEFEYEEKVDLWLNGEISGWVGKTRQLANFVRKYLHKTRGTSCEVCGWNERHPIDDSILTEVDHVDGNAENCKPENLKILCPNHHAMTPTFRRRNKDSKRKR